MGIIEDFKVYSDQFGLTQAQPNSTSGNGLLYTAEYIAALIANDAMSESERDRLINVYQSCEVAPGLIKRAPNKDDQEGPDDYFGVGYASRFLNYPQLAQQIVYYGLQGVHDYDAALESGNKVLSFITYHLLKVAGLGRVRNVWNNLNPGYFTLSSWLGRPIGLLAHLKFGAGMTPNLLEKLEWCLNVCVGSLSSNNDSWILNWLCVRTAMGQSTMCDLVGKIWLWRFKKKWSGGMGQLLSAYFNNPSHPAAIHLANVF